MPTSRSSAPSYHHGDLREAILTEAERALARGGAEQLSLRAIARSIGVSHNAPYKHFATREEILAALIVRGFDHLREDISAQSTELRPSVARGMAYVSFALSRPALFRLMFSGRAQRAAHPVVREASARSMRELTGFVRETYGRAHLADATISAWSFVHGLALLLIDGQIPDELRRRRTPLKTAHDVLVAMDRALQAYKPPE
jgi:AcrR family transcriptional regulator